MSAKADIVVSGLWYGRFSGDLSCQSMFQSRIFCFYSMDLPLGLNLCFFKDVIDAMA